jgi:lipoprotein-releasing system permease protein
MGIIVGAMALFVVLSVFSGLKVFSLSFTNEIDPDLKISSTLGKSFDFPKQEIEIKDIAGLPIPKLLKSVFYSLLMTNKKLRT